MLKFIKNIFAKKEAPEEKISLDELDSWLEQRIKPVFEGINAQINEIIGKINNEKAEAGEKLKALENAQLQNPKIPERVKIIMQGNREGFIKKVSLLFNNIELKNSSHNAPDYGKFSYNHLDCGELIEKCRNIESEIDSLGSSTARNYHILNEFFAREAEKVAASIKSVESCLKDLIITVSRSKISDIHKIKRGISGLKNKIKLKESYSAQLESSRDNLNNSKNKKINIEKKINEVKSSFDCKNCEKLLQEKEKMEIKAKEIENSLFHGFSVMEKALKKYAKIAFEDENLALEYLESPIDALAKDNDFKILKILENLKSSIEQDKLELEEKKKDKPIGKIHELDGAYLAKIRGDFINAKKITEELAIKIASNDSRKALDLLNEELKNADGNIEKANNEILTLSKELEKIDIGKLKEELQKDIIDAVNVKITVL